MNKLDSKISEKLMPQGSTLFNFFMEKVENKRKLSRKLSSGNLRAGAAEQKVAHKLMEAGGGGGGGGGQEAGGGAGREGEEALRGWKGKSSFSLGNS